MNVPEIKQPARPTENRESRLLVNHCFELSRELGITTLLVYAESVQDQRYILKNRRDENIILLSRENVQLRQEIAAECTVVTLPNQDLSRSEQFELGLLIAVLNDLVAYDETVLCMTGLVGSLRLDNLLITNLQRDNNWFKKHDYTQIPKKMLRSREFVRLLDIALRLAKQGREGKAVGTIFVLGDYRRYENYLQQLVLNPCAGHPRESRNIHDSAFFETLREYAALDGAFIVDNDGVVEKVGVYLKPPPDTKIRIPKGLGTRHVSAAMLSAVTNALTIAVSESSSSVMVFSDGSPILQFNQP